MVALATLAQVRDELRIADNTVGGNGPDVSEDAYIRRAIYQMSDRLQSMTEKGFLPSKETRYFDALGFHISPDGLSLDLHRDPFLELTSVIDGEGNALTAYDRSLKTGDYLLPGNKYPFRDIEIVSSSSKRWDKYNPIYQEAIAITGVWGFHTRYDKAWLSSGDAVKNDPSIDASVTTITVADADEQDGMGFVPRFSPGNFLKIESEYLEVVGVDTSANTLTVLRGVNGSTAAIHLKDVPIYVWQPQPEIVRAVCRWAAYVQSRHGAFTEVVIQEVAAVRYPKDLPEDVENIILQYIDNDEHVI